MSGIGTPGSAAPRGEDFITRALAEMRQLLGQVQAAAGNARAVAAAVQTGLANVASSGQTWQGPVNSGSGTVQTTGTVQAGTFNGGSTGSGTVNVGTLNVGTNVAVSGSTGVTANSGTFVSTYARNNSVTTSYVAAYINSDGKFLATASSRKFKRDITTYRGGLWRKIRPVTFRLRSAWILDNLAGGDGTKVAREVGVIAEELDALGFTELVVYDRDGAPWSVHYERIGVVALAATQELDQIVAAQAADIAALKKDLGI